MYEMTLENYCRAVYKYTFARALSSAFYAAHVIVRLKKNPFEDGVLEEAFRRYVWDTPLSNLDLTIIEDSSLEDGVLILDAIEPFGDGESVPEGVFINERIPL